MGKALFCQRLINIENLNSFYGNGRLLLVTKKIFGKELRYENEKEDSRDFFMLCMLIL